MSAVLRAPSANEPSSGADADGFRTRFAEETLESHLSDPHGCDLFRRHLLRVKEEPALVDLYREVLYTPQLILPKLSPI